MRSPRRLTGVAAALASVLSVCTVQGQPAQAPSLEQIAESVKSDPAIDEPQLDGCVRLHHLWKAQIMATVAPASSREQRMVDTVFTPFQAFWSGYLGDVNAFTKWVRASKPLANDPRLAVPTQMKIGALVVETTRRLEQLAGRRACGEWFIVYGPGWTNLGGLGSGRMVLDLFGLPTSDPVGDVRFIMPHELNHLLFSRPEASGTLLYRMIDEGFATFIADEYWGAGLSPADALGYTEDQWRWAVEHEAELWQQALPHLGSADRKNLDRFLAVNQRVIDGAPGKIAYFLGYRIVEDFVRRNGAMSWRKLYEMPLDELVSSTRLSGK